MTFRVENHGVVKGVDEYHDLHGTGLHAGKSAGTPNIHRVSHGCIWLFRKLSFPSTPVTLIGMPKESILFLLQFEVANIEGCGMSILVERRNTAVDHKSNRPEPSGAI